jgi:hypothetical protein
MINKHPFSSWKNLAFFETVYVLHISKLIITDIKKLGNRSSFIYLKITFLLKRNDFKNHATSK